MVWSLLYIPLTLYGWCIEGNWKLSYLFRCLRNFFCWGKLLFVDAMVSEWFDFCFACDKTDAEKMDDVKRQKSQRSALLIYIIVGDIEK